MESTRVALVGAGPIGLELAVALRGREIPYRHYEAGQIGSTISWWAPHTRFFSSPERITLAGLPLATVDQSKATREEYLTYLRSVVAYHDLEIRTYEPVTHLEVAPQGGFLVTSEHRGQQHVCHAEKVVLAIGDMHRPRLLGIPGEELPHVSHYFRDPHTYFRRRVLIVGGKNSAVEAALRCLRVGCDVTLSYRGAKLDPKRIKFWLFPEIRSAIHAGRIRYFPSTVPRQITEHRVVLEKLPPADREAAGPGPAIEVEADFVLLLTGYEQDPTLFRQVGVRLHGAGLQPELDEETMETDVPGLFVAGTAAAGTQLGGVKTFIETSHVHIDRILAALTDGPRQRRDAPAYELPES